MAVVAISRVRNEADIVEPFVRHTAALVDHHLLVDNESTDTTPTILRSLEEEGLRVDVGTDPTLGTGMVQSQVMTRLLRSAAEIAGPDGWVVPLDADEFIDVPGSLVDALAERDGPALVRWRTYVPVASDPTDVLNPVERIGHRLRAEAEPWSKVFVPAELARHGELGVGNHFVSLDGDRVPAAEATDLSLAHFPVRSAEQFAAKVVIGRLGLLAGTRRGDMGFHYEEPFRLLAADRDRFVDEWREMALRFAVHDGVDFEPEALLDALDYRGAPLRYTEGLRGHEPLRSLLEYAEALARRVGESKDL